LGFDDEYAVYWLMCDMFCLVALIYMVFGRVLFELPFADGWFSGEVCLFVLANPDAWVAVQDKRNSPMNGTVCHYIFRALKPLCVMSVFNGHECILFCD